MLTAKELAALNVILEQDLRPWSRWGLSPEDVVAHLTLPRAATQEIASLRSEGEQLGWQVEVSEKLLLSESAAAELVQVVEITFKIVSGSGAAYLAFSKISDTWKERARKLKEALKGKDAQLSALMHQDAVRAWFDECYGPDNWKYDPDQVETKEIAGVILFCVIEEGTGKQHILAAKGEYIEELIIPGKVSSK